jgi:hypothetical protein
MFVLFVVAEPGFSSGGGSRAVVRFHSPNNHASKEQAS